jgi:hypothetical protein
MMPQRPALENEMEGFRRGSRRAAPDRIRALRWKNSLEKDAGVTRR